MKFKKRGKKNKRRSRRKRTSRRRSTNYLTIGRLYREALTVRVPIEVGGAANSDFVVRLC